MDASDDEIICPLAFAVAAKITRFPEVTSWPVMVTTLMKEESFSDFRHLQGVMSRKYTGSATIVTPFYRVVIGGVGGFNCFDPPALVRLCRPNLIMVKFYCKRVDRIKQTAAMWSYFV